MNLTTRSKGFTRNIVFPWSFVQTCDNFRFFGYSSKFYDFEHIEINNRCKYLGGGDYVRVYKLEGGISPILLKPHTLKVVLTAFSSGARCMRMEWGN